MVLQATAGAADNSAGLANMRQDWQRFRESNSDLPRPSGAENASCS